MPESLAAEALYHLIELFWFLDGDDGMAQSVDLEDFLVCWSWFKVNEKHRQWHFSYP